MSNQKFLKEKELMEEVAHIMNSKESDPETFEDSGEKRNLEYEADL